MHKEILRDQIFLLHDFLSDEECAGFVARSEDLGYQDAPITTASGFVMRKDIRDNERLIIDDPTLAGLWAERAAPLLVQDWFGWSLVGMNERFRYYRYDEGQRFAPHTDGYFERPNGERSHFTFLVYLNEGFDGGTTDFHRGRDTLRVQPRTGTALVFAHRQVHEGAPVLRGRKYVLRTDVMYRRQS